MSDLLLERVAEAAIARAAAHELGDSFADVGEALFWVVTLADANGRPRRNLLRGLRWARNAVAHGGHVSALAGPDHSATLGQATLPFALGDAGGLFWLPRSAIRAPTLKPNPHNEAAYDAHLQWRHVLATLQVGLEAAR